MLKSIRLRNLRSYVDTDVVELRKLNVFIGPNNAGKSAFLSAVELFLRSLGRHNPQRLLAFDDMASFASFDSVLRRHWSVKEARPKSFTLDYVWEPKHDKTVSSQFTCQGQASDNVTYVQSSWYTFEERKVTAELDSTRRKYKFQIHVGSTVTDATEIAIVGPFPIVFMPPSAPSPDMDLFLRPGNVQVVRPHRPVPRSFYVVDDPSLSTEDRTLVTRLINIWNSEHTHAQDTRARITSSMKTIGLTQYIDVKHLRTKNGPRVVEIRVAPGLKRQSVTIADVGFGLSQVLPLAVAEATVSGGYLIAYQPELHLHPFAQSRLADVFVGSVKRNNQLFIETHSADMVLRLQSMVASGDIQAESVRVFCCENTKGSTRITPVDFAKSGSPTIPWPKGFLDTSLTLARDLAASRIKNGR